MSETKKGHPIMGVVFGVLGIVVAVFLAFMTGAIGGVIAGIFGLLALIFGIQARRGGRGIAAIVLGVIAMLAAFIFAVVGIGTVDALRQQAQEKNLPLLTKYTENTNLGILGVIINAGKDDVNVEALAEEFRQVQVEEPITATTEAPAAAVTTEAAENADAAASTESIESTESTETTKSTGTNE